MTDETTELSEYKRVALEAGTLLGVEGLVEEGERKFGSIGCSVLQATTPFVVPDLLKNMVLDIKGGQRITLVDFMPDGRCKAPDTFDTASSILKVGLWDLKSFCRFLLEDRLIVALVGETNRVMAKFAIAHLGFVPIVPLSQSESGEMGMVDIVATRGNFFRAVNRLIR